MQMQRGALLDGFCLENRLETGDRAAVLKRKDVLHLQNNPVTSTNNTKQRTTKQQKGPAHLERGVLSVRVCLLDRNLTREIMHFRLSNVKALSTSKQSTTKAT